MMETVESSLALAIQEQRVEQACDELRTTRSLSAEEALLVARAAASVRSIRLCSERAGRSLAQVLTGAGLRAELPEGGLGTQFPSFDVDVSERELDAALAAARAAGYAVPVPLAGSGWEAWRRIARELALVNQADAVTRARFRWPNGGLLARAGRRLGPKLVDVQNWTMPPACWPLAWARRPMRRLREACGLAEPPGFGEWLGTPQSLLPALLRLVQPGPDDVLLDIGCGDGRVLLEAAATWGCRAIGIERDEALAGTASERAVERGLTHLVDVRCCDAEQAPLAEATIVFLFVPVRATAALLPRLLERLSPGARIVAHEQTACTWPVAPSQAIPIFSDDAMTVAMVWHVR